MTLWPGRQPECARKRAYKFHRAAVAIGSQRRASAPRIPIVVAPDAKSASEYQYSSPRRKRQSMRDGSRQGPSPERCWSESASVTIGSVYAGVTTNRRRKGRSRPITPVDVETAVVTNCPRFRRRCPRRTASARLGNAFGEFVETVTFDGGQAFGELIVSSRRFTPPRGLSQDALSIEHPCRK